MDYMFTYMRRGAMDVPIVRIKALTYAETKLKTGQHCSVTIKQPDMILNYEFVVKCPIKSEQSGEYYYAWYQLENLSKSIDRSPEVKTEADQNAANIDYLSMMTGIDIPSNEEEVTDEQEL